MIIGRNQNAWKECHLGACDKLGVSVVRRHSGGGAVYQDLGNTNFSFVTDQERYDKSKNTNILLDSLESFGINAEIKGRNDIVFGGAKISGHAYKYSKDNALHHGTILRDVDMDVLGKVLNPSKVKLQSKGVTSVKSRVTNLRDLFPEITHESLCKALEDTFLSRHVPPAAVERKMLKKQELLDIEEVRAEYDLLCHW